MKKIQPFPGVPMTHLAGTDCSVFPAEKILAGKQREIFETCLIDILIWLVDESATSQKRKQGVEKQVCATDLMCIKSNSSILSSCHKVKDG